MDSQFRKLLGDYPEHERAAYLSVLAALATSDREATEEERDRIREISQAAGLSFSHEQKIIEAAQDTSGSDLKKSLDVLKESNLRFSLITDLIALGKADNSYTEEEKGSIEKVARYVNVDENQFSVLDQFVNKAADEPHTAEEYSQPNFLRSTGMEDKFSKAGFNMQSFGKNIFGFLGPILLCGLAGRAFGRKSSRGKISPSGFGGMSSGNASVGGLGGLGSLLSGMMTGRSSGSMGGMLGRLFR